MVFARYANAARWARHNGNIDNKKGLAEILQENGR